MNRQVFYAHLKKILIKQGQFVKPGQIIGEVGRSGRARGVHLHFELRKDSQPVDPLAFLEQSNRFKLAAIPKSSKIRSHAKRKTANQSSSL